MYRIASQVLPHGMRSHKYKKNKHLQSIKSIIYSQGWRQTLSWLLNQERKPDCQGSAHIRSRTLR
jgi:hypothetical protein